MPRLTAICLALLLLLAAVPLILGGRSPTARSAERRLIIVTPHVQQIRIEFARAFRAWHAANYPSDPPVYVDFRSPGGTSEIIRLLQAQYNAAIADDRIAPDGSCPPGTIGYDLFFGGGTFDHGRLAAGEGVLITPPATPIDPQAAPDTPAPASTTTPAPTPAKVPLPMSIPVAFSPEELAAYFPIDRVGVVPLYHPEQLWIGTALSSFGIVYNRPLIQSLLGKPHLESFDDLADPRLFGWVAMADPRQSGSISTTLDAILSKYGWDAGWKLLRRIAANSRTFVASSARPPLDVSQGEAAAALAIDFYGRSQSQSILQPFQLPADSRVGYVDPPGSVSIDPDPISILRGGPDPQLARRFVQFTLSPEGQALWNFRSQKTLDADPTLPRNPTTPDGRPLGPLEYELRRLPVLPAIYQQEGDGPSTPSLHTFPLSMVDQVNPYTIATDAAPAGWRSAIGPMMGAFAIDSADDCRAAWQAIIRVKADASAPPDVLTSMEAHFDAMPTAAQVRSAYQAIFGIPLPDASTWPADDAGQPLPIAQAFPNDAPWDAFNDFTPQNFRAIRNTWRTPRWNSRLKVVYTHVFRENYRRVLDIERRWREGEDHSH